MSDLQAALRRVAAFGLPGTGNGGPVTVRDEEWSAFTSGLAEHRLTGLAAAALDGGELCLTASQADDIAGLHRAAMMWCLAIERKLLELAEAFDGAGIEFVVLKGPAVAHTVYPDPSWREFNDLDLLVRTRDWRNALAVLAECGCRRRLPEPRPGFDERFGKAATHETPEGIEIDLHRTLVLGPFGLWMDPEELFDHTARFALEGHLLWRLDDTALLANATISVSLRGTVPCLSAVRDVVQIQDVGTVDWDVLAAWARHWKLGVVFRHAFELASSMLDVAWPIAGSKSLGAGIHRRDERALHAYSARRRARGGTATATLSAAGGARGQLAYAIALLFPRREFIRARYGSAGVARLKRWMLPTRWATARARDIRSESS